MPPVLRVENLTIRRGDAHLVRGVSWTVQRGEHWVILGANGSGKTSLLRAVAGYLPPTSGSLSLLGETFGEADWRELRQRLGFVSASVAQMFGEDATGLEIVAGGASGTIGHWGRLPAEQRAAAERHLARIDAAALADKPWLILSQGERQRVLIARALIARPRLLLLDEPCAGLDPVARERFLASLARLATPRGAVPLVLVTHHVEEILPGFTHALVMRDGEVLALGPVARTITSAILSAAFRAPLEVHRRLGRYQLAPGEAPLRPSRG